MNVLALKWPRECEKEHTFSLGAIPVPNMKQDCFLKKEADGTLAALEFLIAWGERLAFALVKFSDIIMKEIC